MLEIDQAQSQPTVATNQEFMKLLKSRVAEKIPVKDQRANFQTYLKTVTVFGWFMLSYSALFISTHTGLSLFLCVSLGLAYAGIGFNVFHDSIHGSFSYRRWVNRFWAFVSCSVLGASHFIWKHKHNYLHHQFPNIEGLDDDLETRGGLRLSPFQPWTPQFRYQHLYAPLVYGVTTIEWIFVRDFIRYFTSKMNENQKLPKLSVYDHFEFWISKTLYFALTVALPLSFFPFKTYLVGFLIVHFTTSVTLAAIFQLAHVMEECKFPAPGLNGKKIEMGWAQLQLSTTVNFAPTNRLLSWYCGGLNFQIEHHLLPGVCHAHYKALSGVVEATAKEFGYPYHSLPTHLAALQDHYRILKRFSSPEPQVTGSTATQH